MTTDTPEPERDEPGSAIETFGVLPEEFKSDYLHRAFNNEHLLLHALRHDPRGRTLEARLDVQEPYLVERTPADPGAVEGFPAGFHLSAFTAYLAVSQLAIAYACILAGKPKKGLGEMIQRGFTMQNRRAITTPEDIPLMLRLEGFRELKGEMPGRLARFAYDVGNHSATGELIGLLPLQATYHPTR